ncbi:MAG TPA: DNA polymerase, partial [Thermaerobacter sp.]
RRWASSDMPSTQLYNSPDQGTGADILKRAMARLRPHLKRLGAELVASVHDELVVECDEDRAKEVAAVVKREMEAAGEEFIAPVPVVVEVGVGKTWADKA